MADEMEIVKAVAPFAAPLTSAIVETWIKPKLSALHKYLKTDKALFENALATKFDEYLQRSYEKNAFINVIALQNRQKRLEEIYIPLTLREAQGDKKILIDGYKEEFIPAFKKVLVRDTAGMGKSTMMKYLFLSCVKSNAGVPIFIELRKLKGGDSILSYIHNELNPIDEEFDKDFILKLIKEGGFIFFFDGYDEIPVSERAAVITNLQDFLSKAGTNFFVLTSRPESSLASFPDFQALSIQPLKLEEAFSLLRKYDNGGELSAEIISKVKGKMLTNIGEFLENPLLVSLLFKSYEYKPVIPFKKHTFYRQVYDALFESHDLTKSGPFIRDKYSKLDIEDFHRVLRALGFITVRLGQIEFDKDTLLAFLRDARERCPGLSFKEGDFLKDLITTVPLFNCEGDYYKWGHKSIQEYFAAQFIWLDSKSNQDAILRKMIRSRNTLLYYNVLDLYYDMDYKTFRRTLIYDLMCKAVEYFDNAYHLIDRNEIKEKVISTRKVLTLGRVCIVCSESYIHDLVVKPQYNLFEASDAYLTGIGIDSAKYRIVSYSGAGLITCADYTRQLMTLLHTKREGIFLTRTEQSKMLNVNVAPMYKHSDVTVLIVDENPDSIINQKQHFHAVNRLIYHSAEELYLHPDKCRQLKASIEKEIEVEISDSF